MFRKGLDTREQSLRLVQEYVNHKVLVAKGCKSETKNQKVIRNAALSLICMNLNIQGFGPKEAYRKLRNIKSTYAQELKKMRHATARGLKYKSNLIWFETWDTALKMYKEEENNIKPEEPCAEMDEALNEESEDKIIKLEFFEEEDCANRSEMYLQDHIKTDMTHPKSNQIQVSTHEAFQNNENSASGSMYDSDELSNVHIAHIRNEFDVFGESIGAQLRNMPLNDALEAQMFIQNYISSFRLQSLRRQRHPLP